MKLKNGWTRLENIYWITQMNGNGLVHLHESDHEFIVLGFHLFPGKYTHMHHVLKESNTGSQKTYKPVGGVHKYLFGSHCYLVSAKGAEKLLRETMILEAHTKRVRRIIKGNGERNQISYPNGILFCLCTQPSRKTRDSSPTRYPWRFNADWMDLNAVHSK
jgi:hypothetical protein